MRPRRRSGIIGMGGALALAAVWNAPAAAAPATWDGDGTWQDFDGSNLDISSRQSWHQNGAGILDSAEANDGFGSTLVIRRLGSGPADLAVGVPGEGVGSVHHAGAVAVIYGGSPGLSSSGDQLWQRDVAGVAGSAGADDRLGDALP